MTRNKSLFIILSFLNVMLSYGQLDSIQNLEAVYLSDSKLIHFSEGFKMDKLEDSIVKRNSTSLTDVLRFNSSVYFKENGYGMVSSPSFRGTNAAQTAVIWNGININSNFTGQTDFNIISPAGYSDIVIRSGGGGVQYGSGAIGGSIHLNNFFDFKIPSQTEITLGYGSFNTFSGQAETIQTRGNHYLNIGVDFTNSKNNYDYVGKNRKNEHGEFTRFSAKINEARKLKRGLAGWNSEFSYSDRNFSGSLTAVGKDGYKDINTRNLWQLQQTFGMFKTTAKAAHLYEQYRYYPNSLKPAYQEGKAHTLIGSLESEIRLYPNMLLHGKVDYSRINGKGENIGEHIQNKWSAVLLMKHELSENFGYGINFRQEFLEEYDNPFLFSADAKWKVSNSYNLRFNGSKNYRIPTFNDLYWNAGGNPDLKPETSYQVEIGQEFNWKTFTFDLAGFYIDSKNMIKWVPVTSTVWSPENIAKARNFGVEAKGRYRQKWKQHQLRLDALYSYTRAEDLERKKQLIYVPYHKFSSSITYDFKELSAYIENIYTGEAFTTSDNRSGVNSYFISNFGIEYKFRNSPFTIGGRIKNLFNTYYENVAYRPMPSRNIQFFINFNT